MGRLDGKTAVVLGAAGAGNMGQVIARRFAAEGARVLVAGRSAEELNRLAEELGGRAVLCDITRREDLKGLADAALAWHGALDVAVNATDGACSSRFWIRPRTNSGRWPICSSRVRFCGCRRW